MPTVTDRIPPATSIYVGIDLAWGPRARTGLATIDGDGRILRIASALTDDETIGYTLPHLDGPCLVAFDAPPRGQQSFGCAGLREDRQ